ncbi:MAG: hypothetical protein EBZ49_14100 [Proteobacteria bacterium]|nr:hypothetical protein [Pseudomonadota bacterium]
MKTQHTTQKERAERRNSFLSQIKGGVAVLLSAPYTIRNNDVHNAYRQDSNFYYLTGLEEPESICLFNPQSKKPFTLFVEPKDAVKELWEGKMLGLEGAKAQLGADEALSSLDSDVFDEALIEALLQADPRSGGRQGRHPLRHPRPVHRIWRQANGAPAGEIRPAVV